MAVKKGGAPTIQPGREKATQEGLINIEPVDRQTIQIPIIGLSPLLVHAVPQKVREIIAHNNGVKFNGGTKAVDDRGPIEQYLDSFYVDEEGYQGMQASAIRKAMIRAAGTHGLTMAAVQRMGFYVKGTKSRDTSDALFRVLGKPTMEERAIKTKSSGDAQLSYVVSYPKWAAIIEIEFNASSITPGVIGNLLEQAGFNVGIGNHRPEGGGDFGRFRVIRDDDAVSIVDVLADAGVDVDSDVLGVEYDREALAKEAKAYLAMLRPTTALVGKGGNPLKSAAAPTKKTGKRTTKRTTKRKN
jgi:hypothetical protein